MNEWKIKKIFWFLKTLFQNYFIEGVIDYQCNYEYIQVSYEKIFIFV